MISKTSRIFLAICAAILIQHSESRIFLDNSGEYDENINYLFRTARRHQKREMKKESDVCGTEACKVIGKELKSSMNTSVDPCENFYDFVCGGWNGRADLIPPHEDSWGRNELMQHVTFERIKGILEQEPEPSDILPVRMAKKWYGACMNREEREKRGLRPIESILMQTGGWPMIMDPEEWSDDDFTWQSLERNYFHITGQLVFAEVETKWKEEEDGKEGVLVLARSSLPLTPKLSRGLSDRWDAIWKIYKSVMKRVAQLFVVHTRAAVTDEMIEKDIDDLIALERKLQAMAESPGDYLMVPMEKFIEEYNAKVNNTNGKNNIDFKRLFEILFDTVGDRIDDDQKIAVVDMDFFTGLSKVLDETSERTIANYIHWRFVSEGMFFTTEEIMTIWKEEVAAISGITKKPPRWLKCINDLPLKDAISFAFAEKYFTKNTEESATEIIENIRKELALQIDESNWLNQDGKNVLLEKLRSMKIYIGFPDWYKDEETVKATYRGLTIGYEYFENALNFNKYKLRKNLQFIDQTEESERWPMDPFVVNAMFAGQNNFIIVPAANFQPPFLVPGVPDAVNYGVIGYTVGHEIGHGYDDSDIVWNKEGEMELSMQMVENYYKRAECFLHQFNNYYGVTEPVYEGTTPYSWEGSIGRRTRGENIADTTGVQATFKAWQKLRSMKNKEEEKLPGFENFTDEQMFFISFAASWCTIQRPEYMNKLKSTDEHSLPNLRVIGAVSNAKEFADVFKCPRGSPMNPDNKCNIWDKVEKSNEIPSRRRLRNHRRRHHDQWVLNAW